MKRKIFTGEAFCLLDTGLRIHLNYYLIEKTSSDKCEELYGIRIEKRVAEESLEKTEMREAEETPVFTDDREMAERFLSRLQKGAVTPIGLFPCVDDMMGEADLQHFVPLDMENENGKLQNAPPSGGRGAG